MESFHPKGKLHHRHQLHLHQKILLKDADAHNWFKVENNKKCEVHYLDVTHLDDTSQFGSSPQDTNILVWDQWSCSDWKHLDKEISILLFPWTTGYFPYSILDHCGNPEIKFYKREQCVISEQHIGHRSKINEEGADSDWKRPERPIKSI